MKLTVRSEYACLTLFYLSQRYGRGFVKTEEIARAQHIPKKYLEQILLLLKRAGYVRSKRGARGGYEMSKSPRQISVAEIVRLMDGPLAPVESASKYFFSHTPIEQEKALLCLFKEIRNMVAKKMEATTFASLIE
ncbi:MAG: Rrf2 family transcriptional regulator [Verrucomicrobia bacterium]|nr:Rrf2 family transcriptional regulator [Verrucomicrobiota bacterium]